jgi:hypothetical protein
VRTAALDAIDETGTRALSPMKNSFTAGITLTLDGGRTLVQRGRRGVSAERFWACC